MKTIHDPIPTILGALVVTEPKPQTNYVKRAPDAMKPGFSLIDGKLAFKPPYITGPRYASSDPVAHQQAQADHEAEQVPEGAMWLNKKNQMFYRWRNDRSEIFKHGRWREAWTARSREAHDDLSVFTPVSKPMVIGVDLASGPDQTIISGFHVTVVPR